MSPAAPHNDAPHRGPPSRAAPARYQPLVVVLTAVAAGIFLDRYGRLPLGVWWGIAGSAAAAWLVLWRRGKSALSAAALLLAAGATAASWHHCRWHLVEADDLAQFVQSPAQPVCIEAIALGTPRLLPRAALTPLRVVQPGNQVRCELALVGIRDGAQWRPAAGRSRMVVQGLLPDIATGDRLRIFAQASVPPRPHNPGQFDTAGYLRAERIRSQLRAEFSESVSLVSPGRVWNPWRCIEQVRVRGSRLLDAHLDPSHAPLAAAVLLGVREQIEPEENEAFMKTGTVHLLSISGMHLAIIAGGLLVVARRLPVPRPWALAAVSLFTVFYMLLVDAEPPVIRATILVVVTCGSLGFGRRRPGFNALALGALVVLAMNPCHLFHTGAQLSFLCVAGLMWLARHHRASDAVQDPLDRLIEKNRSPAVRRARRLGRLVVDVTLVSAAIWLLTLPLVMARFHLFTPVAVAINPLIWIPSAVALLSGFVLLVLGMVLPPLAGLAAWLCNLGFALLQAIVTWGAEMPLGHFWLPGPAEWWIVGFYAALGLAAAFPRLRLPRRWCVALVAGWMAAGFGAAWLRADRTQLHSTFLDVGHGEAIVMELPSGQTVLYDAGQFAAPLGATRTISGYLWSRGITHLDAVVLSHGDVDHYNALPGLLERFSVGVVYVSPVMFERPGPALAALREAIDRAGVPVRELSAGDRLPGGPGCSLEVLHPPRRGVLGPDNANSLVLLVEHAGHRLLLTGDLESPGLDDVLAEQPPEPSVLLVPHHGSRACQPEALAAWAKAGWAVISGSHRWDTRPVEEIYRAAGSRVLHTADSGAVTITSGPAGLDVQTFVP